MNKLVHNLAMLAVLCHLLVGCCWHHAHAEQTGALPQAGCASDCRSGQHEERHDADGSSAERSREHKGVCDDRRCEFVLPDSDGEPDLIDFLAPAAAASADTASIDRPGVGVRPTESPPPHVGSPLRLHLAIQILRI